MEKEYEIKSRNYKVDTEKALRKWTPILDALKVVDPEVRQFMAVYAEFYQLESNIKNYTLTGTGMGPIRGKNKEDKAADKWMDDVSLNLLPINMKVLSRLNLSGKTLEITQSTSDFRLEDVEYGITMTNEEKNDIKNATGMDIIQKMENKLVEAIVTNINKKLEEKSTIYVGMLIQSISMMAMENFTPKMLMRCRYKIV